MDRETIFGHIQRGCEWLKTDTKYDKEKTIQKIDDSRDKKFAPEWIQCLETKLELKYTPIDILPIYTLSLLNDPIIEDFRESARVDDFWNNICCEYVFPLGERRFYELYFFHELSLSSNSHFLSYFNEYKNNTTVEGKFGNDDDHVSFLRLAIALEPHDPITRQALNFSLQNKHHLLDSFESSIFILALMELDYYKYMQIIEDGIKNIKNQQNEEGSWGTYDKYKETYYALKSICRIKGNDDESVKRGIEFILKNQQKDGSWGSFIHNEEGKIKEYSPSAGDTSLALLSLLLTRPPEISLEEYIFEKLQYEQKIDLYRPYFIHTSPIYHKKLHVKGIGEKVNECLNNAKHTIRIISPYIDMHYEDIINLAEQKPELTIKIITRSKKDIKGFRERIAKNVLDLLEIATKGNIKTLDIIHSRLMIIDDQELIISSADLTREGLYDEFNAGIYTKDEDTIKNSIEYFDNIWGELVEEKSDEKSGTDISG